MFAQKRCAECGETKPANNYRQNYSKVDNKETVCRKCYKKVRGKERRRKQKAGLALRDQNKRVSDKMRDDYEFWRGVQERARKGQEPAQRLLMETYSLRIVPKEEYLNGSN